MIDVEQKEWHPHLSQKQIEWIKSQVARYIRIHCENLGELPNDADADHSALLEWLLQGKEPFNQPPPCQFSYPAYGMAAGHITTLAKAIQPTIKENERGEVPLGQNSEFIFHDRFQNLLKHEPTDQIYEFWEDHETTPMYRGEKQAPKNTTFEVFKIRRRIDLEE